MYPGTVPLHLYTTPGTHCPYTPHAASRVHTRVDARTETAHRALRAKTGVVDVDDDDDDNDDVDDDDDYDKVDDDGDDNNVGKIG